MNIQLPLKITQQLLQHAQSSPETEVCGLIGSLDGVPASCYPVANSDLHPQNRFTLEPAEQIGAFKTMREKGETLFAIYHSHPHTPAEPSATDLELASYPEALYLIISLNTKGVLEMRGFNIADNKVSEVGLTLYS